MATPSSSSSSSPRRNDRYVYQPVPAGSIRLISFEPTISAEPNCKLRSIPLSEAEPYSVLSYAWDDHGEYETLSCHGMGISVTPNCKAAIMRLAEKSNHCMQLWVDAVCINQLDREEVDAQLAIMCEIYKRAVTTRVWLGEDYDNGEYCLRAIRETVASRACQIILNNNYNVDKEFGLRTVMALGSHLAATFMVSSNPPFMGYHLATSFLDKTSAHSKALDSLLRRSWFSRLWILQEVAVSRNVVVLCGNETIPWGDFCSMVQFLIDAPCKPTGAMSRVQRINSLRERYQTSDKGISIDEAIIIGRRQKCTKPQDRVWSMTGLSPELAELISSPGCRRTLTDLVGLMSQGRSVSVGFRIRTWYRLMVENGSDRLSFGQQIERRNFIGKYFGYWFYPLLGWGNLMRFLKAARAEGWRDFDYWWHRDEIDGVQEDSYILEEWIKLTSSNASYKVRMVGVG